MRPLTDTPIELLRCRSREHAVSEALELRLAALVASM
jgi:hypothetical protein